jgi:2-polyprenyl-3-methyl-5-hydroxy-6-metoxy-1,4-benzoquinol methylase
MAALDLGCGEGRVSILLAEKGFSVDAVDRNQDSLDVLRGHIRGLQINNIKVYEVDIKKFKFQRNKYDLAVSLNLFHLLSDPDKFWLAQKVYCSMKPGPFAAILVKGTKINILKIFSKFDIPCQISFEADGVEYLYIELGKPPLMVRLRRIFGK